MFKDWLLGYASYVILETITVPAIEDGFKPVQRQIMHFNGRDWTDGRYEIKWQIL
jgi:topoisomerase-4 subunit A